MPNNKKPTTATTPDYIDVDDTVLAPSPHRLRNILTLEERMRAIQAYDCRPMYTKVAKMFNCSWEQIKNIIANRDAIVEFYEATKKSEVDSDEESIRHRKIRFLGECMYEFIQRAQFHAKAEVTQELISSTATEFRDLIQIKNFSPNKAWINHFKATYNFSLSNRQIMLKRTPPASLDLKDIMTYCTRNKTESTPQQKMLAQQPECKNLYRSRTKMSIYSANESTLEELKQRRQRKITFLEKALHEYIQRSQFHHKMPVNEEALQKVAYDLKDALKIENFFPNSTWFSQFKSRYNFNVPFGRTPPLSLDLKDILSYCSRYDQKNASTPTTITLAPKEPSRASVRLTNAAKRSSAQATTTSIKILNPTVINKKSIAPAPMAVKEEVIDLVEDESEQVDVKPNASELKRAIEENGQTQPHSQPLKIPKTETAEELTSQPVISVASSANIESAADHGDDPEVLPARVLNYSDALKLLKPLEEFALLEENYRVIGLLSQLEEIFKNRKAEEHCQRVRIDL